MREGLRRELAQLRLAAPAGDAASVAAVQNLSAVDKAALEDQLSAGIS
jgi:hypothetical protein